LPLQHTGTTSAGHMQPLLLVSGPADAHDITSNQSPAFNRHAGLQQIVHLPSLRAQMLVARHTKYRQMTTTWAGINEVRTAVHLQSALTHAFKSSCSTLPTRHMG
jgi:hypothetical protein